MKFGTVATLALTGAGEIDGVEILKPARLADGRGSFMRVFDDRVVDPLVAGVGEQRWVQENQLRTRKGAIRGFHYRAGVDEAKLVRVVAGEIFDVIVDLRPTSSTYRRVMKMILDDRENLQIYIPPGCAHAIQALSDTVEMTIRTSAYYEVSLDRNFRWDDADVGVNWPLGTPTVSDRDLGAPQFSDALAECAVLFAPKANEDAT